MDGGRDGDRTHDPQTASLMLSQLSYPPTLNFEVLPEKCYEFKNPCLLLILCSWPCLGAIELIKQARVYSKSSQFVRPLSCSPSPEGVLLHEVSSVAAT